MSPTTEKSHMSNISYKVYMSKIIICHTLAMSTVIVILYSCMVTMCMCIYVQGCVRTSDPLQYICKKNLVSYGQIYFCIYHLQYKCLAMPLTMALNYLYVLNYLAGSRLHVAYVMYSFWSIYIYLHTHTHTHYDRTA